MTGQILKQHPADTAALCLRGRAHHYLGDMQLAKKHFSEALRSDPDHAEAKSWFKSLKALLKKSTEVLTPPLWEYPNPHGYLEVMFPHQEHLCPTPSGHICPGDHFPWEFNFCEQVGMV